MNNTVVSTANASTSNEEVRQLFNDNEAFKNGRVVLAAIEPTSNNDVVSLMFVQQKTDLPSTGNPALTLSMGWKNQAITVRTFHNADVTLFNNADVQIGDTGEKVFSKLAELTDSDIEIEKVDIAITDSTTPDIWTDNEGLEHMQKPLTTKSGTVLNHNGKFIYRKTEISINDMIETVTLKPDRIVVLKNQ